MYEEENQLICCTSSRKVVKADLINKRRFLKPFFKGTLLENST